MNKMKRKRELGKGIRRAVSTGLITILMISVLATMAVPSVFGDVVLPTAFYGNVTVNGAPAPVDTVITGRIVDATGSPGEGNITVTEAGKYGGPGGFDPKLSVTTDNDNDIGKTIEFYIKLPSGAEGKAPETATYDSEVHELDLTATIEEGMPIITDWYNNKTKNNATEGTINESECVYFNATADQAIDTWRWFVNDTDQAHNFDNFTYCGWTVNGTYYVKVDATNANGTSSTVTWTVTVNDITAPAKVTGLTNGTPSATAVDLWWNANTEADLVGYKVYQDDSLLGSVPKTQTYYNVTGLSPSTTYEFNVSAYDDNDLEGENATVIVKTPAHPAPTITGWNNITGSSLSVTVNETEAILFNATADQVITTWNWLRDGESQPGNYDNFTTSWDTNGSYAVSVNATNVNGTSNTVEWTVTVNDITAPAKVTGLTNGTPSATAVDLWWNANTEADLVGYKVYKNGSLLDTTANTYYNVTGLLNSTTYEFNVSAYDDNDNEGERSDGVTITTATILVTYNLTISSTAGGNVTVPGEGTFTYNESEVVNLKAVADAGYVFVNWTGEVGMIANVNSNETTITMNDNYTIVANFAEIIPPEVVINEIMYNPIGTGSEYEWIEIYNNGSESVDLTGWRFYEAGVNHVLTLEQGSMIISADGYAIIANNATAFLESHSGYTGTVIDSSFSLSDTGETIALKDSSLREIDNVTYIDDWGADGNGRTLELNETGGWEESLVDGGTPGEENSVIYTPVVTTVEVSPSEVTLNVTETQPFTATAYDQYVVVMPDIIFLWSSSNETVGTIDATTGWFTARVPGTTTVTATNGTVNGTAEVTVTYVPELTNITVEPPIANLTLPDDTTQQFTATAYDQYDEVMPEVVFTWVSLNPTVGTIDDTGLFTALAVGTATVGAYNASVGPSINGTAMVNVSSTPIRSVTIELVTGYNMISMPLNDTSVTNASSLIDKIGADCLEVSKWDKDTQAWKAYAPGQPSIFDFDVAGGEGCFVSMSGSATVVFTGMGWTSPFTISLVMGYDMIGIPVNDTSVTNASSLIDKIGVDCTEVSKWNKDTQAWKAYAPGQPSIFDFDIGVGEGCFVSMADDAEVTFEGEPWSD